MRSLTAWVDSVQAAGRLEDLTNLEIWLKALSAFFNPEHVPLTTTERADIAARNFAAEARIARRAIQVVEFHVANLLASDACQGSRCEGDRSNLARVRARFPGAPSPEEEGPADSLMRLLDVMNDLRVLIDASTCQRHFPYQHYLALGRLLGHSQRDCRYIRLLLDQKFKPQYDVIENAALNALVRRIGEDRLRQNVGLVLLHLFQLQRLLLLPGKAFRSEGPLRHLLAVFALLHDEMHHLSLFIRSRFGKRAEMTTQLRTTMGWLCESLRINSRRAIERQLALVASETSAPVVASKMARSYDLLQGCFQGCTVSLAQTFEPCIGWNDLFANAPGSVVAAHKVQRDLWDLRLYVQFLAGRNGVADLEGLMERLVGFRETWLHSFADSDWGEFERLSGVLIHALDAHEFQEMLNSFGSFLETLAEWGTARPGSGGTCEAESHSR